MALGTTRDLTEIKGKRSPPLAILTEACSWVWGTIVRKFEGGELPYANISFPTPTCCLCKLGHFRDLRIFMSSLYVIIFKKAYRTML